MSDKLRGQIFTTIWLVIVAIILIVVARSCELKVKMLPTSDREVVTEKGKP